MAVAQLNTVTTSEAVSIGQGRFTVSSTASISVRDLLVFGQEAMEVQAIPVSGQVDVLRGVSGTIARPIKSGARGFSGTPDKFTAIRESATALTGNPATLPQFLLPGQRAVDGFGNEYVLLDLTFTAFTGVTVLISRDGLYTAAALLSTSDPGAVAVMVEEGTSAQYAWGQIYGAVSYTQYTSGSSLATSTGIIQPASSATVPVGAVLGRTTSQASSTETARIFGMYPTSAVTTATTAATSATGFQGSTWLNYPFTLRNVSC